MPQPTDHFDGVRFFNPGAASTDRTLRDLLRWRRTRVSAPWGPAPSGPAHVDHPPPGTETLRVAMVGHASLLVQGPGHNILVDPIWSDRASPFAFAGPRRHQPPGIALPDLPPIDTILLTHNHYDHMDIPTLRRLWRRDRPRIIAPLGNDTTLNRHLPAQATTCADWWDTIPLGAATSLTLCPANHWSSRTPWDRRRALWCGYILQSPAGSLYCAGDTGYADGGLFARIAQRFPNLDAAVLPIGAYEPRWFMSPQHMNPDEAVRALISCGARQGLGIHWGTFQLTDEPRLAPLAALADAIANSAPTAPFIALVPGQVWQAG